MFDSNRLQVHAGTRVAPERWRGQIGFVPRRRVRARPTAHLGTFGHICETEMGSFRAGASSRAGAERGPVVQAPPAFAGALRGDARVSRRAPRNAGGACTTGFKVRGQT